jgi:hypothetical protein
MKMELKFDWKDALIVAIGAPLIVGIILYHYPDVIEYMFGNDKPDKGVTVEEIKQEPIAEDIVTQLKSLQNPNAPFKIAMWINTPGMTQFTTENKVVLHYKISELLQDKTAYFSLFNISPTGELSQLLLNKPIKGDNIYSVPEAQTTLEPDAPLIIAPQLTLEKGQEYFRAIVTLDKIMAEKLMAAPKKELQQTIWGTESLTVQVNSPK